MTPEEKKAAKAAYDREYRAKNAEKIRAAKAAWGGTEVKKAYDKRWAEENRERSNSIKKAWKERNPDADKEYYLNNLERVRVQTREYYERNAETIRSKTKEWRKANPHHASALAGKRANSVRRATPAWADKEKMRAIYQQAREQGLEVDHVIPIQGTTVSGLHVEHNLQIVTRQENRQKGNRYAG